MESNSGIERFLTRWQHGRLLVLAAIGFVALATLGGPIATVVADDPAAVASADSADDEQQVLTKGYELERQRMWADAVQHYESALRRFPDSRVVYQRLLISRLRYDVHRRYTDHSFLASVRDLSTTQALDLYSETLANLQTHYVETVDWSRVLLHGTAALEVALDEERFINSNLPGVDRDAIEQFRLNVHRELRGRSTQTRFDLRAAVSFVANLAHERIGLSGTATSLEFLSGAISTLDPYTRLLSGSQLDEMFSNIEGNFVGLGVELKPADDHLQIVSVIPGGPADEAGVLAGERIVRVADAETNVVDPDFAADLLRGPENSVVSISVADTAGRRRDLQITRRRVDVPCVENVHLVDVTNRVGYFRLTNFQKTTRREVEQAVITLQGQGMRSLIMDLRGNPGGLLTAAVEVADRFLSDGAIVTTRGRNAKENFDYRAHRSGTWNFPLVVLIDGNSASASEIFAGAMSDRGRAVVVGSTSYGKGSVQGVFRMRSAKFGLCLTTAKFYSPSGRAISQNGVRPHAEVSDRHITGRPDDQGHIIGDDEDAVLQHGIAQLAGHGGNLVSSRPSR
ncbi:S41 family peptidase [Crateriforma conspicua]|uniref:Putative CtpA-like serine protease n=1 Tax=Crateriforma conspicua TaxID=2527996 RepID=A0A5C5Y8D5_9PLAN|nr:S41 family peptidase [Crateriforma conspicua]TWT69612.1 putative CtpA-like serine protease [Crateriforma conspicua]